MSVTQELTSAAIRQRIANLLKVPVDGPWTVVDQDPETHVYMISVKSYDNQADDPAMFTTDRVRPELQYQNLRGVVVSIQPGGPDVVLVDSYVFTPRAQADRLVPVGELINLTNQYGDVVSIDINTVTIRRYHEGVVIRLFPFNGKVYFATSNRLVALTSRWAAEPAPTFYQMYLEMGGVPLEQLAAQPEFMESGIVSSLLLVHQTMQMAVLADAAAIVILDQSVIGQPGTAGVFTFPFGVLPSPISIDQANHHLQFGTLAVGDDYVPPVDSRLSPGEALLITRSGFALKVESPAHAWRLAVLGNNASPYRRLVSLLDVRTLTPDVYRQAWPNTMAEYGIEDPAVDGWTRFINTFNCLVLASPYSRRDYVKTLLRRLFGDAPENNYLIDPYTTQDYLFYPEEQVGEMFQLMEYFLFRLEQFVNRTMTDTLHRAVMKVLETVKGKCGPAKTTYAEQRAYYVHEILFRPHGDLTLSGSGINQALTEMRLYYRTRGNVPAPTMEVTPTPSRSSTKAPPRAGSTPRGRGRGSRR